MIKSNQRMKTALSLIASMALAGIMMCNPANAQTQHRKNTSTTSAQGFAVVELFTSQGCSSCPSADENLAAITKQAERDGKQIITLSFHVDYWNNLGWKDPYSSSEATTRQRLYAGVHGLKQVYTPQMVINGTTELLGSSREKSKMAIQAAIKKRPQSSIQLTTNSVGKMIEVSWQVEGLQPSDLMNLALVQNQAEDRVETGENGGRTLKHVNVVRGFRVVNSAKEKDSLSLTIPDGLEAKDLHVVAYLQASADANIHAVATSEVIAGK